MSAPSRKGSSDPGGTTVPSSSWQIRPCSVSHPTRTVNSGAGRRASAGQLFERMAILGHGVGPALSRGAGQFVPRSRITTEALALASAQSASNSRCSSRSSSPDTMAPVDRVEGHLARASCPGSSWPDRRPVGPAGVRSPCPPRSGSASWLPVGGDPLELEQRSGSCAWSTSRASSRARASSVSGRRRAIITSTWASVIDPFLPGPAGLGQEPELATPVGLAPGLAQPGIRHRAAVQAGAVRAPSGGPVSRRIEGGHRLGGKGRSPGRQPLQRRCTDSGSARAVASHWPNRSKVSSMTSSSTKPVHHRDVTPVEPAGGGARSGLSRWRAEGGTGSQRSRWRTEQPG